MTDRKLPGWETVSSKSRNKKEYSIYSTEGEGRGEGKGARKRETEKGREREGRERQFQKLTEVVQAT